MSVRLRSARAALAAAMLGLGLALCAGGAAATLYKWTDANGRVVYSDQPPAGNVKYEIVGAAPPPANPNAVRDMAAQDAEFRKRQSDKSEASAKSEKARADAARLAEACTQARGRIRLLQDESQPLVRYGEKGERIPMTPEDRKRAIEDQQRVVKEACAGG